MIRLLLVAALVMLTGCGSHRLTGYNIKPSISQVKEDGKRSEYIGLTIDAHVDVK